MVTKRKAVAAKKKTSRTSPKRAHAPVGPKLKLGAIRKQLVSMRDDLMKTVRNQQISDEGQADIGDSVDEASRSIERELLFELSDNERVTLDQIDAALHKIDRGVYGACESCRKPIAKARLDALPFARYCIRCQNSAESTSNGGEAEAPNFGAIGEESHSATEIS
ncbi:MAG: TraR/DksA family transcriptional regulator [Elusimicrobia bacterium]|nr:TraR/DksA family transcriptional regulator [Elusimicrobiota bacterium]MDE2236280.1 TraR/DksA family transcriptional regulator [Elusimicrobiota bacterium]MDE2426558.1 TraR/DksA family transcriptional regulator [Elusimicrobiota bacterium]